MGTNARPNIHFFTPEDFKKAPKKRKNPPLTAENKPKARYRLTNLMSEK